MSSLVQFEPGHIYKTVTFFQIENEDKNQKEANTTEMAGERMLMVKAQIPEV